MNHSAHVFPTIKKTVFFALFALLLFLLAAAAAEEPHPSAFRLTGTPKKDPVPVYTEANRKSEVLLTLESGASCEVLSETEKYYVVSTGGVTGYASKGLLNTEAVEASPAVPETLCPALSLKDPIPDPQDNYLVLQGTLSSDSPVDTLFIYVWDERRYQVEKTVIKVLPEPSDEVDLGIIARSLHTGRLSGGRKTIYLEGVCNGELRLFYRSLAYVCRKNEEPVHVTRLCEGLPDSVLDSNLSTAWCSTSKNPSLRFTVPEAAGASLMTLAWREIPGPFTVQLLDENGKLLSLLACPGHFYEDSVSLTSEVREIRITPQSENRRISTLRVYSEPWPRHAVRRWEEIPDKVDILFVSTHQDDEMLFFGGAIPAYAAREDVTVAVVYMTTCSRPRAQEGLDGLWTAGLRYHPVFLGLKDHLTYKVQEVNRLWKDMDPETLLVDLLCRYRPDVVVCQDYNGEYGHAQHKVTATLVTSAIERAANPELEKSWNVKKFYVHLYKDNQIHMDWTRPLDDTGIVTPLFLAMEGYDKHYSQQGYFSMRRDGVRYDNTLFGLVRTTVGPDVLGGDFLENLR